MDFYGPGGEILVAAAATAVISFRRARLALLLLAARDPPGICIRVLPIHSGLVYVGRSGQLRKRKIDTSVISLQRRVIFSVSVSIAARVVSSRRATCSNFRIDLVTSRFGYMLYYCRSTRGGTKRRGRGREINADGPRERKTKRNRHRVSFPYRSSSSVIISLRIIAPLCRAACCCIRDDVTVV